MGPELLQAESLLDVYRALLSWLGVLMTWMGGLLVALSALGAILYVGLLWELRGKLGAARRLGAVGSTPSGVKHPVTPPATCRIVTHPLSNRP